jgi:hypothetical protein
VAFDAGASPIRDLSNVLAIAEIVRRFDVMAVQEVRRSAQAFLAMMTVLGPDWAYLVTDVTDGRAGNNERLAFVFDPTRLRPSGLACELVVAAADNVAASSRTQTSPSMVRRCERSSSLLEKTRKLLARPEVYAAPSDLCVAPMAAARQLP